MKYPQRALLLVALLIIPVLVISGLLGRVGFIYSAARLVIRTSLRLLGVRPEVRGLDSGVFASAPVIVPPFHAPKPEELRQRLVTAGLPESGMETLTLGTKSGLKSTFSESFPMFR